MIKFFRKIRQQLLTENKTSKYLFYAIGEIVLVVIGILIALSINNWNNEQKNKQAEIKHLNQIHSALKNNQFILNFRIDWNKKTLEKGEMLFDHLKSKKALNDTILRLFIIPQYDQSVSLNTAAFENLKSDGLSLISNDSLKIDIINIYDQDLNNIQITFANQIENFITSSVNPFYNAYFEVHLKEDKFLYIPNDYDALLQNREMTNMLSNINALRIYSIRLYENTQEKLSDLILKIESEIKSLKE
jgi:hypothetical protein